jgi:predicted nuclease of predicted toxin-antitoxin system
VKFLLDESAEFRIAGFLESDGHDVTAIAHDYPASLEDPDVLELARTEQRVLITNDRDFGELVFRRHLPHAGVIYFRVPLDTTAEQKIAWLQRILAELADRLDQFIVVEPHRIRVRRSPPNT